MRRDKLYIQLIATKDSRVKEKKHIDFDGRIFTDRRISLYKFWHIFASNARSSPFNLESSDESLLLSEWVVNDDGLNPSEIELLTSMILSDHHSICPLSIFIHSTLIFSVAPPHIKSYSSSWALLFPSSPYSSSSSSSPIRVETSCWFRCCLPDFS